MRRVRSNLDDIESFAKTVDFVPRRASFEAADADLLKLLIEPLYGDSPEIGIRELVQNAVDAVRELHEFLEQQPEFRNQVELSDDEPEVTVSLEKDPDGICWLRVIDRGIGMTPEILCDYFLCAGASYRRSEAWRKRFEDVQGRSRVLRSGRFGIGALATFLLGDRIHVATRHIEATRENGIEFSATLETEAIELRRLAMNVGTTVSIQISPEMFARLEKKHPRENCRDWDWYCLDVPGVQRVISGATAPLEQEYHLPSAHDILPPNWRRIEVKGHRDVHWTYSDSAPFLTCNGLSILRYGGELNNLSSPKTGIAGALTFRSPKVSVFDPDGNLPVNLQRNALTGKEHPFRDQLVADIVRDAIAFALVNGTGTFGKRSSENAWSFELRYPGLDETPSYPNVARLRNWFCTEKGFAIVDPWTLRNFAGSEILLIAESSYSINHPVHFAQRFPGLRNTSSVLRTTINPGRQGDRTWIKFGLGYMSVRFDGASLRSLNIIGRALLLSREIAEYLDRPGMLRVDIRNAIDHQDVDAKWCIWRVGKCGSLETLKGVADGWLEEGSEKLAPYCLQLYLAESQNEPEQSIVARIWQETIGSRLIPFNPAQRRKELSEAYEKLRSYIEAHEALAKERDKPMGERSQL